MGRTPSSLAMKLTNIASLDPSIRGSGRKGLTGASNADRAMWEEMSSDWSRFSVEIYAAEKALHLTDTVESGSGASLDEAPDYSSKDEPRMVLSRIGQSLFRNSVLSAYDFQCCVSGFRVRSLLIASHIVPWKIDMQNRLNPHNGLCLSALHDRAFDGGLISFDNNLQLLVAQSLRREKGNMVRELFLAYEGKRLRLPEKFHPDLEFVNYHRREVFHG